jgi:uridine kinase
VVTSREGGGRPTSPTTHAQALLELVRLRPATLGGHRLVCIDGPAGSGKTTLAEELAASTAAAVVHMDDLYEGWTGLPTVTSQLDSLLLPLAVGLPGSYRRWDWLADGWAETVSVPPVSVLVLEGVGSGASAHAQLITVLVWVDAPQEVRKKRSVERDGAVMAEHWQQWAESEQEHFAREDTRRRADFVVDESLPG